MGSNRAHSLAYTCPLWVALMSLLAMAPGCAGSRDGVRMSGLRSRSLSAIEAEELIAATSLPEYRRTWPEVSSRSQQWVLAIGVYQTLSWPGANSGHSGREAGILVVFEDRDGSIGYITNSPLSPNSDPVDRMLGGKAITIQRLLPPGHDADPAASKEFESLVKELHRIGTDTKPQVDEEGSWTEGVVGLNVVEISRPGEHAYVFGVDDLDWEQCASSRASEQVIALWQRMVAFAAQPE